MSQTPFVAPTQVTGVGGNGNGNGGGSSSSSGGSGGSSSTPATTNTTYPNTNDKHIPNLRLIEEYPLNFDVKNNNTIVNTDAVKINTNIKNIIPFDATNESIIEKNKYVLGDLDFHRVNVQDKDKNTKLFILVEIKNENDVSYYIDYDEASKKYPQLEIKLNDSKIYIKDILSVFEQLTYDYDKITGHVKNLYSICGRFPDPDGLRFHANNISSGKLTIKETIEFFANSNEFKNYLTIEDHAGFDVIHHTETAGFTGSLEAIVNEISKPVSEPWYNQDCLELAGTF